MALKVVWYLKGTMHLGIYYPTLVNKQLSFVGYTDSDFANSENCKSQSGYVFQINGAPISWCSKQQKCVTTLSTAAEYVAAAQCCYEAIWLQNLLKNVSYSQNNKATVLYKDNQGCIALAQNAIHREHTKHINVQYHFICEKVDTKEINLVYISTHDQTADIFTKALNKSKFERCIRLLGLQLCV